MVFKMWILQHFFQQGALGKGMVVCNGPVKGTALPVLKRLIYTVSVYCFFTEWSCEGALDGLEKGELFLVGAGLPSPITLMFNRTIGDLILRMNRTQSTLTMTKATKMHRNIFKKKTIMNNVILKEHSIIPTGPTIAIQC